jgi:hypothetical protein
MKVWIETRDAVNLIQRSMRAVRKSFQLRLGQKAVAQLNCSQLVEYHRASRLKGAPNACKTAARRNLWY